MTYAGVGITTKDRHEVLRKSLAMHWANWPHHMDVTGWSFVIVDDGSRTPLADVVESWPEWDQMSGRDNFRIIRHDTPQGIAASKNHLLAHFMDDYDREIGEIFLWDDDAYPTHSRWAEPFVNHPQGHLQHNYPGAALSEHDAPLKLLYDDGVTIAYHSSRGVMLYYRREIIERVGGMDTAYQFGFEHIEHSERIRNAGLTTWAHQSPVLIDGRDIHACDEYAEVEPVITSAERRIHTTRNLALLEHHRGRSDFVPYRPETNMVLSCLYTGVDDPQAGRRPWKRTPKYADDLIESLESPRGPLDDAPIDYRIIHNQPMLDLRDRAPHWVCRPMAANSGMNVYIQRWVHCRDWIIANPHVDHLWIVDCSDVVMQGRPGGPFAFMQPDTLYIGYEPMIVGCDWMMKNHDASLSWIKRHAHHPLYNAGVLGGDRSTVLLFIDRLLTAYRQSVVESKQDRAGDMGFIQQAAHDFPLPVVTGPEIVTVFKGYEAYRDQYALWRHK